MKNSFNWKLYFILLAASIISIIASLPYAFSLAADTINQSPIPLPLLITISIVQSSILFAIVIFFGIKLSKKIGLGLPIIEEYISSKKKSINIIAIIKSSILIGIMTGIAIIFGDFIFTKLGVNINLWTGETPPFWMGVLASIYGAIGEEILLRLFFMTFLIWLFSKIGKSDKDILKNNYIIWSSIIISTILFGLGHLPITSTVTILKPLVIIRAILLNGIGGIVFAWLYRKKGLESAMIAHFSADITLHAIFPILLSSIIATI